MVELRSDAIQVQVGNLLRGRAVQLDHPFQIEGYVAFSGPGLSRSFCTPQWRPLGDQLVDALLGLTPLQKLSIELSAQQITESSPYLQKDVIKALRELLEDGKISMNNALNFKRLR